MKKIFYSIYIICFFPFSGCLQFQESDLDPNSPLNALITLSNLNRINSIFRISPRPDLYLEPTDVEIFFPPGATVRFTLDGSIPGSDSISYNSPIPIGQISGKVIIAQLFDINKEPIGQPLSAEYRFYNLETGFDICYNNTGSIACNGDRQDGDFRLGQSESWVSSDSVFYLDRMTGITWQKCQKGRFNDPSCSDNPGETLSGTWQDSIDYCSSMDPTDPSWELPSLLEYASIIDFKRNNPALNLQFHQETPFVPFWTRTELAYDTNEAHFMSVLIGDSYFALKSTSYHSRCNKSNFNPVDFRSFTNLTPDTVYDRKSGLIWQKCNQSQDPNTCSGTATISPDWESALSYCRNLNLAGRNDWRLPNIKELLSILDFSQSSGAITSQEFFPNTPTSTGHWSSTTYGPDPTQAWVVNLDAESFPGFNIGGKSQPNFTKCVAGPEYIPTP